MNGTLNFALGLQTSNFLSGINGAIGKLTALIGVSLGVGAAVRGMTDAMARGGQLFDLSVRTGASVEALYKLEEGFKQIGLEAGNASPMIMKLQRAIGTAEGQDALRALGLSGSGMARMDAAGQIEAVANALGRLDANSQAAAAFKLMGREGATNMLQIARSGGELSEYMRQIAGDAEVWGRNAARFDALGDTIVALKSKLQTLFAGILGGLAPAIQRVLDYLNGLDFAGFGERLGQALSGVVNIFKNGQVTELVALSLGAGFELAVNGFAKMMMGVLAAVQAGLVAIFSTDYASMLQEGVGGMLNAEGARVNTQQANYWSRQARAATDPAERELYLGRAKSALLNASEATQAYQQNSAATSAAAQAVSKAFADKLKDGLDTFGVMSVGGPAQDALMEFLRSWADPGSAATPGRRQAGGDPTAGTWERPVSSLEKMGFIFDGGGNASLDFARRTAKAAEKTAQILSKPLKVIVPSGVIVGNE